jgi:thiamine-phosphate pyrophosphorylase
MSSTPSDSAIRNPQSAICTPQSALRTPRLIAITDATSTPGGWSAILRLADAALGAGLPALMLRDKTLSDADLLPFARDLRQATRAAGALLIVNRRLDLARAIGADGVHLGATGPAIAEAREAMGPSLLIGYSAHAPGEALDALAHGADYVTFSPVFATPSKAGILEPVGIEALATLARQAPGRVIALGGIDRTNLAAVMQTGAAGAAVIRAVFGQANPAQATRELIALADPHAGSPTPRE